jgi:hypothetical protein
MRSAGGPAAGQTSRGDDLVEMAADAGRSNRPPRAAPTMPHEETGALAGPGPCHSRMGAEVLLGCPQAG